MKSPKQVQNLIEFSQGSPSHAQPNTSLRVDTSEYEFDYSELKKEQEIIDKGLNFLLNFKHKKPFGRPPKNVSNSAETNSLKVPDFVSPTLKSITNLNDLHPGVLLDYLIKINSFNKKILHHCNDLHTKVQTLNDKFDSTANIENVTPPIVYVSPEPHSPTQSNEAIAATIAKNEQLELKLDALEQKSLSNILTCSGDIVNDIHSSSTGDNRDLMLTFTDKLKLHLPVIENGDITNVTSLGRDKKVLKICCANYQVKIRILKKIRDLKLPNIYFSEYLTSFRQSLYYKLRSLKKTYPSLISSTYTRGGNIFFKLPGDTRFYFLRTNQDLENLKVKLEIQHSSVL